MLGKVQEIGKSNHPVLNKFWIISEDYPRVMLSCTEPHPQRSQRTLGLEQFRDGASGLGSITEMLDDRLLLAFVGTQRASTY
jgi:hypothetical protein